MEFENVDTNVKKSQGNVGVARAVYEYTKRGYTVLAPLSDSDKYDLVVDIDGDLKKVQVKTSRFKAKEYSDRNVSRSGYVVNLATKGGNTKKNTIRNRQAGDYDLLFVLLETGNCWSIPASEIDGCTSINLGTDKGSKYDVYKME